MVVLALVIGLLVGVTTGAVVMSASSGRRLAEAERTAAEATVARERDVAERVAEAERTAGQRVADAEAGALGRIAAVQREADAEIARLTAELAAATSAQAREDQLLDAFRSLSGQALDESSRRFLELATERFTQLEASSRTEAEQRQRAVGDLVAPVGEQLDALRTHVEQMERLRHRDQGTLTEALSGLRSATDQLHGEAARLAGAMRDSRARGSWGELQLRRVVELAGMAEHADFSEQVTAKGDNGTLRPDLVVWLPEGRSVVIDAKVPLDAYLRAADSDDQTETRTQLSAHAEALRRHAKTLGAKRYPSAVTGAVDLTVMFVPGEGFLAAACEADPTLLERTIADGVVLATPTTLIAMLKAVAHGWRQQQLAEHATEIAELGAELYDRIGVFTQHLGALGSSLDTSVERYNKTLASLESRLLVTARKLADRGAATDRTIDPLPTLDLAPRRPELPNADGDDRLAG